MPVERVVIMEDSALVCRDLLTLASGTAITQASCTSISYRVCDVEDVSTVVASGTWTISDVIFDTLQVPASWTRDTTGYNFGAELSASCFPAGNKIYRVDIALVLTTGQTLRWAKEVSTLEREGG